MGLVKQLQSGAPLELGGLERGRAKLDLAVGPEAALGEVDFVEVEGAGDRHPAGQRRVHRRVESNS